MNMCNKNNFFDIVSFYRFINIHDKNELKKILDKHLNKKLIKGTILLSNEGINGTLSGKKIDIQEVLKIIKKYLNIRKIKTNHSTSDFLPFNRMKVRIKKEIVSLGQGNINSKIKSNKYASPEEWNDLINDKDVKIVDVRNIYEIKVGKFKGSINPNTQNFRDFISSFMKFNFNKKAKVAMYCTGGIRCEKASAQLKILGYKNIYQLEGGIINYLNYAKKNNINSMWDGECFVFDERVAINSDLKRGKYLQCYGCRSPIKQKDTLSKKYKKGISCPHCFNKRTKNQIKKSKSRQRQIDHAKKNKLPNVFLKEDYIN